MTKARHRFDGIHLDRVLVDEEAPNSRQRVFNLTEASIRLNKDQLLGDLYQAQVELNSETRGLAEEVSCEQALLGDLPEDVPLETREQLRGHTGMCSPRERVTYAGHRYVPIG